MTHATPASAALCLVLLAALPVGASAQRGLCTGGPPTQLGDVEIIASGLPGPGVLVGTTVDVLQIRCEGIPPIYVQVHTSDPPPGVPVRGTIVFGTGAEGVALFSLESFGAPLMRELQGRGFRIVDRGWVTGWFADPISAKKQSCRYATLLDWIYRQKHTAGAFCALGSSGGAGELGYALTTWGAGAYVDVALFTGGPPFARFDLQCPDPPPPTWLERCQRLIPPNVMECGMPLCSRGAGYSFGMCSKCSAMASEAELRDDSILHRQAVLDFPRTRVHLLFGALDCLEGIASGMLFFEAVTSEKITEFVPGTGHFVCLSQLGRAAIVRAALGGAASRPGPAAVGQSRWPHLGGTLALDLMGTPGSPYFMLLDVTTQTIEVPPFGWLFLNPTFTVLGAGQLDPVTGAATFTLPVAPIPRLTGYEVFAQALVGTSFTNATRFEFLP